MKYRKLPRLGIICPYAAEVRFYSNDGKYQGWATQNPTSPNEWNRYSNDGRYLGRIVTDKPQRDARDEWPQKEPNPFFFEKEDAD